MKTKSVDSRFQNFKDPIHNRAGITGIKRWSFALVLAACVGGLSPVSALAEPQNFFPGDIVVDMTGGGKDRSVYDGYGMVFHLLARQTPVNWVIHRGKSVGDADLVGVMVDPAPDRDADLSDGRPVAADFFAGPFIIPDPDRSTPYNEAWEAINAIQGAEGFSDIRLAELRESLSVPGDDASLLTYLPRIASDNSYADDELSLVHYPAFMRIPIPGKKSDPGGVSGGALFKSGPCGPERMYDIVIQGHYGYKVNPSWAQDTDDDSVAQQQLDAFVRSGGLGIFECVSASLDRNLHWVTREGTLYEEGTVRAEFYSHDAPLAYHPFLQTHAPVPTENGHFKGWDPRYTQFRQSVHTVLFDDETGGIGYLYGTVDMGSVYFMSGHKRNKVVDRRLMLDAILFHSLTASVRVDGQSGLTSVEPATLTAGIENEATIVKRLPMGAEARNVRFVDVLGDGVELDPQSVQIFAAGGAFDWDVASRSVILNFASVRPQELSDGVLAKYTVRVTPAAEGPFALLKSAGYSIDYWFGEYHAEGATCLTVDVGAPEGELFCDLDPTSLDQDLTGTGRTPFHVTVSNTQGHNTFWSTTDHVHLVIPEKFGEPSNIVYPTQPSAAWVSEWDALSRVITFMYGGGSFDWTPGMSFTFGFDLKTPSQTGVEQFYCTTTIGGHVTSFLHEHDVIVTAVPAFGLLRNDQIEDIFPPMIWGGPWPVLHTIFTGEGFNSLDKNGPDGIPGIGEGNFTSANGSADDDDFYILNFVSGSVDPDPVLNDVSRPLIYYQVTDDGNTLHMGKAPALDTVTIWF